MHSEKGKSARRKVKPEQPMTPQRLEGYAMFLLGRQDYTIKRMKEKLSLKYPKKSFEDSEQIVAALMEKLSSYGYLNDERFLSSMLASLLSQSMGASKIKQRLIAKGFSGDQVQGAMSQLKEDDENDFFSKALAFKNRKFGEAPILDRALAQKALRALVSKGFSFADSQKAIRHVSHES